MKIIDMFQAKNQRGQPLMSLEIFPPKNDSPLDTLLEKLQEFTQLGPDYISVTYGAGGSQKGRTLEISSQIKHVHQTESMAHLTCVGHSQAEIDSILSSLKEHGIENLLALKGDPPAHDPHFDMRKNAFQYAEELIRHIRTTQGDTFCIAAACYIEGHVETRRLKDDLFYLKRKVDAGVDFLVTQLFFDNRLFYDFLDKAASIGIACPISPGIMPIFKADQIKRITALCGASIPAKLVIMMDKYADNPEEMTKAGIDYAITQIQDLLDNKVAGIHLLSMNRPKSSAQILGSLKYVGE